MSEYSVEDRAKDFQRVQKIINHYKPKINPFKSISTEEFVNRQKKVAGALKEKGYLIGLVYSDELYCGDVPYLGGNTNITIEQVAGIIGPNGFHIIAGLEGGYVAEQLSPRAKAIAHKVEMLQLADEKYPIAAERLEDVLEVAAGKNLSEIKKIALLTPRQVIPYSIVRYLEHLFGIENVVDEQTLYYKIKNLKSDRELELISDACTISDAMMRAMLAVLKPGMLETEVASWAYYIGYQLGAEMMGFKVIVGTGDANRTLIGQALNRRIKKGDWVHLGAAPKRDGLTSCIRRSVIAGITEAEFTKEQRYWFDFIEQAYNIGYQAYIDIAEKDLPAKYQEQALVDFFSSKSEEVSAMIGKKVQLEKLKPYTGTHNSGYTECQEFYGAITLESEEPLETQVVTMLDVALRGFGNMWNDVIIPNFDYIVIENTLGKWGKKVRCLNDVPLRVQSLLGKGL